MGEFGLECQPSVASLPGSGNDDDSRLAASPSFTFPAILSYQYHKADTKPLSEVFQDKPHLQALLNRKSQGTVLADVFIPVVRGKLLLLNMLACYPCGQPVQNLLFPLEQAYN